MDNSINEKRFQNITLYKNCPYESTGKQGAKILEEYNEQNEHRSMLNIDSKEKKLWLPELFDLIQATYTMMFNNFTSEEIKIANKLHIEKMIRRYDKRQE